MSSGQQEALKWLAVVTMVVDHVGLAFFPEVLTFRVVGRLALPLFAFLMAYNLTARNVAPSRYYAPLALLLGVSIIPHWLFVGVGPLNIFAVLLAGVLLHDVRTGSRPPAHRAGMLALAAILAAVGEYGVPGALAVPALAYALHRRDVAAWTFAVAVLLALNGFGSPLMLPVLLLFPVLEVARRLPLDLPRMPRPIWYGFYPAHLLALFALARISG